jgi:uncharacterized protein (DUF885 family)
MAESTALEALTAELLGDVGRLHDEVKGLASALPGACEAIREAGSEGAGQLKAAVKEAVAELAKDAAKAEAEKLQAAFTKVAEGVLQDIRKQAHAAAPSAWKIKVAVSLAFVVALSGVAGAIVGSWYVKHSRNDEEVRQLAAGKDFLAVLPQLDQATREKLERLIEKSRQ